MRQKRVLQNGKQAEMGSVIFELNGQAYIPLYNLRGDVIALLDAEGSIAESYRYSAFGEGVIWQQDQQIPASRLNNPWQYCAKRLDAETGLYYFGRRYYDPNHGRFLNHDPKGFVDSLNLYAFVHNNPLTNHDLYGEMVISMTDPNSFSRAWNYSAELISHPQVQGSLQALGGMCETGIGAWLTLYSGGTLGALGWPIMTHGMDQTISGIRKAATGTPDRTLTTQMLQKTGMSQEWAETTDNAISMFSILGGSAAINSTRWTAMQSFNKNVMIEREASNKIW